MELVERTANRTESGGRTRYYGNFKCPFCGNIVERLKHNGRNQKSCGCNTNTGQPTKEKSRLRKEEAIKKFTDATRRNLKGFISRRGLNVGKNLTFNKDRDYLFKYANSSCNKCKGTGYVICDCCKAAKRLSDLHKFLLKYANPRCIKCLGTAFLAWEIDRESQNRKIIKNAIICDCVVNQLEKGAGLAVGLTAEETLNLLGTPVE